MDILRSGYDGFYSLIKPFVFRITRHNPEIAHDLFSLSSLMLYKLKLDKLVLDNSSNSEKSSIGLSNAAGFNKNAEIPSSVMEHLGFERNVIGTVTYDSWAGNAKPRCVRFVSSESMVNNLGLPGEGALKVADRLSSYSSSIPITINIMSTPSKKGDSLLKDLEGTVLAFRDFSNVDRFELNVSCPNISSIEVSLSEMLEVVESNSDQDLYVKVSPDLDSSDIMSTVLASGRHNVSGFVTTNTSVVHIPDYVTKKLSVGGASGNALYDISLETQERFSKEIAKQGLDLELIACGGINSGDKVRERMKTASEIQVCTPVIFSGPKYLREIRDEFALRYYPKVFN